MNEINFLKNLITDAELELQYIELYQDLTEKAREDNAQYKELWMMRNPSRQRIRDDLKMIRQVTLSIERGIR